MLTSALYLTMQKTVEKIIQTREDDQVRSILSNYQNLVLHVKQGPNPKTEQLWCDISI